MPQTCPATGCPLPTLHGERVILRLPVPADVAARVEVPRDPEEHRMYGGDGAPKVFAPAEVEATLAALRDQNLEETRHFVVAARAWPDGTPIADADGRHIGRIRLHHIDWTDCRAQLAIGIFDRRFWSHGFGREAVHLLLRYAFDDLNLHRVGLRVLAANERAIRCYRACGFVAEGVEREAALIAGAWLDDLMMGILEQEYRAQA